MLLTEENRKGGMINTEDKKSCAYVGEGEGIAYKKVVGKLAELARVKGIHMRTQKRK